VTLPEVTSYAALKGKALTVDARTTGYAFVLEKMLQLGGLRDGEYELLKVGGVLARFDDLMQYNHAGTLLLSPFEVSAEARGFRVLGSAIDAFAGHYQGLVATTRREWAKEHASELIGYIRGYIAGLGWLYDPRNKDNLASEEKFASNVSGARGQILRYPTRSQTGFQPHGSN
jgi:ABC-type nitrate/sulfonate/bicarbonate transport system substrate-binding protein